jgi:hypothetical protein
MAVSPVAISPKVEGSGTVVRVGIICPLEPGPFSPKVDGPFAAA